jgi:hypothetical protein
MEILQHIGPRLRWRDWFELWLKLNFRRLDKWQVATVILTKILKVSLKAVLFFVGTVVFTLIVTFIFVLFNNALWDLIIENLKDYLLSIGKLGLASLIPLVYTIAKDIRQSIKKPTDLGIRQYISETNRSHRVGFLSLFRDDYEYLIEIVARQRLLVVFVDDLDRCTPPKPAEIIEGINLLLGNRNSVFVIGMDSKMVATSLEVKYKDLTAYVGDADDPGELTLGHRFLEKIIQINFHIPRTDPQKAANFVDVSLGYKEATAEPEPTRQEIEQKVREIQSGRAIDTETPRQTVIAEKAKQEIIVRTFEQSAQVRNAIHLAVGYLGQNPRKIKRFINNYRLQVLIANRRGLISNNAIDLTLLAKWLLILTRWPEIANILPSNGNFVESLKQARIWKSQLPNAQIKGLLDVSLADPYIKRSLSSPDLLNLLDTMSEEDVQALLSYQILGRLTQPGPSSAQEKSATGG